MTSDDEAGARPLRVVVIAERDAFNAHVLRVLSGVCAIEHVLTAVGPHEPALQLLRRLRPTPRTVVGLARNLALRVVDGRVEARAAALLADGSYWPDRSSTIPQAELLDGRGAELLTALRPDLLVLSGAPLLPAELFSLPRLGTVNLHCGLSQHYRGNHGLLFPLVRRELDAIGSTLHHVDAGIDTGALIAQGRPPVSSTDGFATVWAATARISAVMLAEFVTALQDGPIPGAAATGRGELVRYRDRRVHHHVRLGLQRRLARLHPVRSPGGTTRFAAPLDPAVVHSIG